MRYARRLGAVLLLAAISASGSRGTSNAELVSATCSNGSVIVTAKNPWHINSNAPWMWDKGSLVSKSDMQVKFKGSVCEGTVKAFIASGDQLKGPVLVPIK
jgi:hypothetical protein